MWAILILLKSLLPSFASQRERDEAYLAEAVDIRDLERRMREIDQRGRHEFPTLAEGLYGR